MDNENFFQHSYSDSTPSDIIDEKMFDETLRNAQNVFSSNATRPIKHSKRLNAFDTQLFEEQPLQTDTELLSPSEQISRLEADLKKLDEKIEIALITESNHVVQDLQIERYKLIHQIDLLKSVPKRFLNNSLYSKFVTFVANLLKKFDKPKRKIKYIYKRNFITKTLRPIARSQKLREAIGTLDNLNQNVNQLSKLRIPYGEQEARYEELTKYISQATSIQALIKKDFDEKK